MQFTETYERLQHQSYGEFFVGMNSAKGFIGTYDSVINEEILKRVYIIKGAAGTGKSTFMRRLSEAAKERGIPVVRYSCSSDPASLDCIVLDSKVAILDGTSPHVYEMVYPGAVSEIIDLTKFWDNKYLSDRCDDIITLSRCKSECFCEAYGKLSSLKLLFEERYRQIEKVMLKDKLNRFIERLIKTFGVGAEGTGRLKITRCISTKGRLELDTLKAAAEQIICINDVYGSAYIFMKYLSEALTQKHIDYIYSPDPLGCDIISDIFIGSEKLLVTIDDFESKSRVINMSRFTDNGILCDLRGHLKLSKKCSELLDEEVLLSLKEAGRIHSELESIYGGAMDFTALNNYCDFTTERILAECY